MLDSTKGGALITTRDPQNLHVAQKTEGKQSLALSGTSTRTLWSQVRPVEKPKRYKAVMKQVVGTPFAGLSNQKLECEIIRDLVSASQRRFDDPGLPRSEQRKLLDQLLEGLLSKIKELIGSRIAIYLKSITSRLLDPGTNLRWSATQNNCQNFCDALIDTDVFAPLIDESSKQTDTGEDTAPLYLMSFVCRPGGYAKPTVKSKFDVPNGLTEEYLLRFRYGRHDEADIIDTLQEYWYDWGAFGKHLYKFQDLFPWDCTEAYGRYPVTCGECNIAKHVWAFPFDSWSIISLHLARDRYMYTPVNPDIPRILSNEEWQRNRLMVLKAQDALIAGAVAMAQNPSFLTATSWLGKQDDPQLDRLKLGGIHRAQPFSHYFEQGTYHHYFIAEWAHLKRADQIAAYELLRDGRMKMPDVRVPFKSTSGRSYHEETTYGSFGIDAGFFSMNANIADAGFSPMVDVGAVCGSNTCASGCGSNCGTTGCGSGCGGNCGGGGCGGGCGGGGCGGGGGG